VPSNAAPSAEGSPDDDLLMELARIVADAVPQEAPQAPPPRRPPVLIAPRRPVTPNMRPLPSERAAAAARAAAEAVATPPAPEPEEEAAKVVDEEVAAVPADVAADEPAAGVPPEAPGEPESEPELDEFERALSAELGAAPLRSAPEAAPALEARRRPAVEPAPRPTEPAARAPEATTPIPRPTETAGPAGLRDDRGPASAVSGETAPRAATPPRPTVEDLAAALSLELDLPGDSTAPAASNAPAERPQAPPVPPTAEAPRPVVKSAANVWLAELPALELPPAEEPADGEAPEEASAADERARRQAEREARREQRRAAKAQRRGQEGDEDVSPVDSGSAAEAVAGAAAMAATVRATPVSAAPVRPAAPAVPATVSGPPVAKAAGSGRPAEPVMPAMPAAAPPSAGPRPGAPPFDFAAFEAEIRSSLDDGPLPEPARPAAPRPAEPPRAADPVPPAKPAMPKPAGLAPMPVPGRPGEAPAPAAPVEAVSAAAAPRAPKAEATVDQGFELDLLESEPGHSEEAVLPPHSDAELRALRTTMRGRRRVPVAAVAAAAAVVLLAGGATAWWMLSSETVDGPPPLIQADSEPVKVDPPVSETRDAGEPGKAFTDRVGEAGDPARQVLDPEGRQTIDLPIAGREAGDPSLPGVDTDDPLAQLAADPNEPVDTVAPTPAAELQPKKVRTVVVRPDGTIVPQDLPTLVSPQPQAPPAAGLNPNEPAADAAAAPGAAPADGAAAAPALAPVPAFEPLPAEDESLAGAIGYPMPRRKPLVFDEPSDVRTVPRPTSNLPDPLPTAGAEPVPVFASTQGVNTGAAGTAPAVTPAAPAAPSASDAAAAALGRGTTTGETAGDAAAPAATVPAPTASTPAPVVSPSPEPVAAAPEPAAAPDADTRTVTTTPVRVAALPPSRQAPPPPAPEPTAAAAPEAPLALPTATPAPETATAPAAAPVAAGRSARLLPPAGSGTNPFAPAAQAPAPQAAAPAEPAAPTATAPAPTPVATTAGGAFAVQLASQKSDAEARAAYASLQRRFPSILGGLAPVIQTADVGTRGTFYRVRLPFGSAAEANRLCNELKAAGGDCFVGRN
jgi:hypothetical protein